MAGLSRWAFSTQAARKLEKNTGNAQCGLNAKRSPCCMSVSLFRRADGAPHRRRLRGLGVAR